MSLTSKRERVPCTPLNNNYNNFVLCKLMKCLLPKINNNEMPTPLVVHVILSSNACIYIWKLTVI